MATAAPDPSGASRRRRPGSEPGAESGARPAAAVARPRPIRSTRQIRPDPPPVSTPDPALAGLDALAFATDPRSEAALRAGLAECQDAQVWPGDLRTAAAALAGGYSPRLLFVDLDRNPYAAGAIYELAAVCEVGTAVVALGSDDTARFSREILLAGVNDYLVKPIDAAAVREAALRAAGSAARRSEEGWLVGFAGTGGSGATTLAAAVALVAAERGRYVSVLDLNRTFPTLSFLLDVEPAGGLVDLLSTVARASLHPEMVDGMRAVRSDRIAVYGYPWSAVPPPLAPVWAVCELFVELQRRSHLVIVDGMDDPATRHTLLSMVDARVFVVEPTATGAASAARLLARLGPMLGPDWPFVLVQNHTRTLKSTAAVQALRGAGIRSAPDVVVPFEPTLPSVTDRGWPESRLPRTLRNSFARLADLVLARPGATQSTAPASDPTEAPRAASRPSSTPAGRPRSSAVRSALRRLAPLRARGPRPV